MTVLFVNQAFTTLQDPITDVQTAFALVDGSVFPDVSPADGNVLVLTLFAGPNLNPGDPFEVIYVYNKTGSSVAACSRANEEPWLNLAWPAGTEVRMHITSGMLALFPQISGSSFAQGNSALATTPQSHAIGYQTIAKTPDPWDVFVFPNPGDFIKASATGHIFINTNSTFGANTGGAEPTWDTALIGNITNNNGILWMYVGQLSDHGLVFSQVEGGGSRVYEGYSTAFGAFCNAAFEGSAFGMKAIANRFSLALGFSRALAQKCIAIGYAAVNRISATHVISGLSLLRKDAGEDASDTTLVFTGSEVIMLSKEIDLKVLLDNAAVMSIPSNSKFFVDEVGVIVTNASGVVSQPSVSFGANANTVEIVAPTATTKTAVGGRDTFSPLTKDGKTAMNASVKVAATGTSLFGRFYWKGFLVENQ